MHTLPITLRYRPLRIGWCIADGDFLGFRSAVQHSFTMWGGRFNPIIPVDDKELSTKIINLYRVDILFNVSKTKAISEFIETQKHLHNPLYRPLILSHRNQESKAPVIVDIQHPIAKLYGDYFKNNPKAKQGVVAYQWNADDTLADVMLCTYGAFPPAEDVGLDYLALIGSALLGRANPILSGNTLPIPDPSLNTISSLNKAFIEWDYVIRNYWDYPGFYIGHADDWHDLVMHWNLKAAGIQLLFYDPQHATRMDAWKEYWLAQLRAAPARPAWQSGVALWHRRECSLEGTDAFGKGLTVCKIDKSTFNGLNLKVPMPIFGRQSTLASVGKSYDDRPEIAFSIGKTPFADIDADDQHYVLSVDPGIGLFGDERATLYAPFLSSLNEYYGRNIYFQWNKARAEPESLGIITDIRHDHLTLRALQNIDLISEIFKTVSIKAELSSPGLLCATLIHQMGGLSGCRSFKIEGVRKLIENYTPDQSFSRSTAMQTIHGQGSTRPLSEYSLFIEPHSDGVDLNSASVFGYLLDKGVFRAGLRFRCPSCQLEFWRSLDETQTRLECEYCGHLFKISRQLRDKDWAFRRSGLFGRNDHQEGSIPVVLTLQQLMQMHTLSEAIYCGAMRLKSIGADIKDCETDFVLVNKLNSEHKIQIVIGECKSRKEITELDVVHLASVANSFPSESFSVYVVFAKLTKFTESEIHRIKTLNDNHHLRAIILTDRELEPYFVYERTKEEFDIDHLAVSFEDMARITHQVFFEKKMKPLATVNSGSEEDSRDTTPN